MKTLDYRLNGKMGFYLMDNAFTNYCFDEVTGAYFIQFGFIRPNGEVQERPIAKRLVQAGAVLNDIDRLTKSGYTKTEKPKNVVLRTIEQIQANASPTPSVAKVEKPLNLSVIPQLELIKGKTVKISKQVIPIREGVFDHVPKINKAYFFPEQTNDVILDILERRPIILTGHTGCGKTSLYEQIAARINQPIIRANMNGQTTIGDFVGMWTVKGGDTEWVDGVLPRAMKEGHWLVIDELDCADAAILATLNAVLEKNGVLTLKEKGFEVVKPHENFRLFATANTVGCMSAFRTIYQGTNIMNEAFLDRFRVYLTNYLPAKEETQVLTATLPTLKPEIAQAMVQLANMVRESFVKEDIGTTFSTRRLIDWAEMYLRHGDMRKAAKQVIFSKIPFEDAKVIEGLLVRIGK